MKVLVLYDYPPSPAGLDRAKGPVVLEANARPRLAVQIANRTGLAEVLEDIDATLPAAALPSILPAASSEPIRNFPQGAPRAHDGS